MVRSVCIAVLLTTVVAGTTHAQQQSSQKRGILSWLQRKTTSGSNSSKVAPRRTGGKSSGLRWRGQRQQQPQARYGQRQQQQYRPQYRPQQDIARRPQSGDMPKTAANRPIIPAPAPPAMDTEPVSYRRPSPEVAKKPRPQPRQSAPRPQTAQRQQAQRQAAPPQRQPRRLPILPATHRRPVPARRTSMSRAMSSPVSQGYPVDGGAYSMGTYPQTSAGLYPSPQPNVPWQVGSSSITNPAFHPHEYLYAHEYRAMYPPYYYKVHGKWLVTPFGVWSKERWKPVGTEVRVKYRSSISPFAGFIPPLLDKRTR